MLRVFAKSSGPSGGQFLQTVAVFRLGPIFLFPVASLGIFDCLMAPAGDTLEALLAQLPARPLASGILSPAAEQPLSRSLLG